MPDVRIAEFHNRFLVDFANEHGATFMLRGIRSTQDYEYERVMRHINADMAPKVCTVFLMPPRDTAELSSSMIKGLIGPEGWESQVSRYVPHNVFAMLKEKYREVSRVPSGFWSRYSLSGEGAGGLERLRLLRSLCRRMRWMTRALAAHRPVCICSTASHSSLRARKRLSSRDLSTWHLTAIPVGMCLR